MITEYHSSHNADAHQYSKGTQVKCESTTGCKTQADSTPSSHTLNSERQSRLDEQTQPVRAPGPFSATGTTAGHVEVIVPLILSLEFRARAAPVPGRAGHVCVPKSVDLVAANRCAVVANLGFAVRVSIHLRHASCRISAGCHLRSGD